MNTRAVRTPCMSPSVALADREFRSCRAKNQPSTPRPTSVMVSGRTPRLNEDPKDWASASTKASPPMARQTPAKIRATVSWKPIPPSVSSSMPISEIAVITPTARPAVLAAPPQSPVSRESMTLRPGVPVDGGPAVAADHGAAAG